MSKYIVTTLLVFVFLFGLGHYLFAESYFYFEPFTTTPASGWWYVAQGLRGGLWYNKEGIISSLPTASRNSSFSFTGGRAVFTGNIVSNNTVNYLGVWVGTAIGFTNKLWNPSPYNPFGFEILRVSARIDPHDDSLNPESRRHAASMDIFLAEYTNLGNSSPDYTKFPNQIVLYDMMRMCDNVSNDAYTTPYSQWGVWESSYSRIYVTNLPRLNGSGTVNLKPILEWNMDDNWVHTNNEGVSYNQYANPNPANNNQIKIMVTHDGTKVSFYVNPLGNGGTPNEMILLKEVPINWTNNVFPLFGVGTIRYDTETQDLVLDDFYIRTIASAVTSEVVPYEITTNSTFNLNIFIKPVFGSINDAGVSEVWIKKPSSWTWFNWASYTNQIAVMVYSNTTLLTTFSKSSGDVNPASGSVAISIKTMEVSGDTLKIRFRAATSSDNQIIRPISTSDFANKFIRVIVSNVSTSGAIIDNIGKDIEVYVDNPKYADTWTDTTIGTAPRYATTGKMKSYAGDVINVTLIDSSFRDGNTLTVKVFDIPKAYGGITPNIVYQGTTNTFYYDISTRDVVNGTYITSVKIRVPSGFIVKPNTAFETNISSLKITDPVNSIRITNEGGITNIYIEYWEENNFIPGENGIDKITIKTYSTPIDITNRFDDWLAYVNNRYVGGLANTWTLVSTNSQYPSRTVESRRPRANVEAWIDANGGNSYVENTSITNTYRYVLKNNGLTGNNILTARIYIPPNITNVTSISSGIPSVRYFTNISGSNFVYVGYSNSSTNLPAGTNDVITFVGWDNVPPLTNEITNVFVSYVDNGNGDGYVPTVESSLTYRIRFVTPPARARAKVFSPNEEGGDNPATALHHVYVDYPEQYVEMYIENVGEEGNEIFRAYIYYPSNIITNVYNFYSTKIGSASSTYVYTTNVSGSNFIVVDYAGANNKLLSGQNDIVSFRINYNLDNATNITLQVYVANSTNFTNAVVANNPIDNNQDLHFIYSPVGAYAYVTPPPGGYVPKSVLTNLTFTIDNTGVYPKNSILAAKIYIPPYFADTVTSITSSIMGSDPLYVFYNAGDNNIYIIYTNGGIVGGGVDTITVWVSNKVVLSTNVTFTVFVTNKRSSVFTNLIYLPGQSLSVLVSDPPVNASYYVDKNVFVALGSGVGESFRVFITNKGEGANELTYVKIDIPTPIQGKVTNVTGIWTNINYITYDSTKIEVIYSNYTGSPVQGLDAGSYDIITVYFTNNVTDISTNLVTVQADNSPDFPPPVSLSVVSGKPNSIYFVNPSLYKITPNQINVSATRSVFTNYITAGVGYDVKLARIILPYPFVTNNIFVTSVRGASVSIGSNYVELNYGSGLPSGQFDMVILSNVLDTYDEVTNYTAFWSARVDYIGDGSFVGCVIDSTGTNHVTIIYSPAEAEAYVTPESVGEDFDSYTYTFSIKNVGQSGNNIKEVMIIPSAFITDISNVTSDLLSSSSITNSNNVIILKYSDIGDLLPDSSDTITLVGYDSIDTAPGGAVGSYWAVKVNNSPYAISYTNAYPPVGRSLTNIIYKPNYRVDYYIEMSNRISSSPYDVNKVYTTSDATNVMYYYINNYGGTGNNLLKLFIKVPSIGTIISTNGMSFSSAKGVPISLSNNGEIVVDYSSSPLVPGDSDVITIEFKDLINDGETNVSWTSESIFSTTAGKRKPNNVQSGKFGYVSFVMPLPYASASIVSPSPREIFVSDKLFNVSILLTNTGIEYNIIRGARIDVPSTFSLLSANTPDATNSIVGNSLYVYYTNGLSTSNTNIITITLSNKISNITNVGFTGVVWNSRNTNTISEISVYALRLNVVSLPSVYLYPNEIDTSDYYTNYVIYIRNDSSGTRPIRKVKIEIPNGVFNNIDNLQSSLISDDATYVSNFGNTNIYIDYTLEGKSIVIGDQDRISFIGYDNLDVGSTNIVLKGWFYDSDEWREMKVFVGYRMDLNFTMPRAFLKASIDPDKIYVSQESNRLKLTVTNEGRGSNKLVKVRFTIPYGISNISLVSNTLGGIASNFINGDYFEIWYSNTGGIPSGQADEIYVDTLSYYDILTNIGVVFMGGNEYNGPWYVGGIIPGGTTTLRVLYPPLLILSYVSKGDKIYTIDTNATVEYKIINKSRGTYITNVWFKFDLTNFYDISITSSLGGIISTNSNSNTISVSYTSDTNSPSAFGFDKVDIITITFNYNLTNFYAIPMIGEAWVIGDTNTNTTLVKPSGLGQIVYVTNAPFARIIGYVSPVRYPVSVKQVDSSGNIVKDSEGNDIISISSTNDGKFFLREVYPDSNGKCILSFENENYRNMTKEFYIEKNKVTNVGIIFMLNKPFSKSSDKDQDIVSPSDNKSKVIIKQGNINRDFSVDLYITNLTELQKNAIQKDDKLAKPKDNSLMAFFLDVRGYSFDELIKEIGIDGDIILYFYYPSVVSNAYVNEDKFGIYYWKPTTGEWIRVGGQVDKQNKFIIAKVSYLSKYYAVLESAKELIGVIRNVTSSPRVFTPVVGGNPTDPDYGIVKISFEFDKTYNEYEVSIYSLDGRLVKSYKKQSSEGFVNGVIGWDGKDMDGKMVRNGVYVYRIKVGENVYTGTIVLVK